MRSVDAVTVLAQFQFVPDPSFFVCVVVCVCVLCTLLLFSLDFYFISFSLFLSFSLLIRSKVSEASARQQCRPLVARNCERPKRSCRTDGWQALWNFGIYQVSHTATAEIRARNRSGPFFFIFFIPLFHFEIIDIFFFLRKKISINFHKIRAVFCFSFTFAVIESRSVLLFFFFRGGGGERGLPVKNVTVPIGFSTT